MALMQSVIPTVLDQTARVTYCNDYILRLTGWQREEVIGRDWLQLFLPPEEINVMQSVTGASKNSINGAVWSA